MEFDTYGNNIICPHCRYENTDEELDDDETGIIECGGCGRPIRYSRYVDITYTTDKVDWLEEWKVYNHNISNQYDTMRMLKELNNED